MPVTIKISMRTPRQLTQKQLKSGQIYISGENGDLIYRPETGYAFFRVNTAGSLRYVSEESLSGYFIEAPEGTSITIT
jgi:hypothetical protein